MAATGEKAGEAGRLCRAETLIGARVVTLDEEEIGRVEAIMIDPDRGRATYAVLSFGALMGMGDRLFPVPWKLLRPDPDKGKCTLGLRRESMKTAPGFSRSDWPRMSDREWAMEIHGFYGERPYWEEVIRERRSPPPGRRSSDRQRERDK